MANVFATKINNLRIYRTITVKKNIRSIILVNEKNGDEYYY